MGAIARSLVRSSATDPGYAHISIALGAPSHRLSSTTACSLHTLLSLIAVLTGRGLGDCGRDERLQAAERRVTGTSDGAVPGSGDTERPGDVNSGGIELGVRYPAPGVLGRLSEPGLGMGLDGLERGASCGGDREQRGAGGVPRMDARCSFVLQSC